MMSNYDTAHPHLGGPPRYISDAVVKLTLRQSLRDFWRFGTWQRERRLFRPIFPGQPGYDSAPYDMGFLFQPGKHYDT